MKTLVRVTLVMVGTAAYVGLAILGWGGWTAFFAHPARVATVVLAVLAGVSLYADENLSPGLHEDRGNRWVIGVLRLLGLLTAYLPAYTDRHVCWTLDGDPLRWLGVGLFAVSGTLRLWPVLYSAIGSAAWSPSSPDTHWLPPGSMELSATQAI